MYINEIFYSIQGEGFHVGSPCIFVRLSGCNMTCSFCDTKHEKYTKMSIDEIIGVTENPSAYKSLPVVITGGEPLAQKESGILAETLVKHGRSVIIETNGTVKTELEGMNGVHICVSPKIPIREVQIKRPDSLKLLYPFIDGSSLLDYMINSRVRADHVFIQPISNGKEYVKEITRLIKFYPEARLSVQVHKIFKLL